VASVCLCIAACTAVKPLTLLATSFAEVLFLDVDNVVLRDPSFLFDHLKRSNSSAIFWPDYWSLVRDEGVPSIWDYTDLPPPPGPPDDQNLVPPDYPYVNISIGLETGQLVIDKGRSETWRALLLTTFLNWHSDTYFPLIYGREPLGAGDKDTFLVGWYLTGASYTVVQQAAAVIGSGKHNVGVTDGTVIGQHDPSGHLLFLHANQHKYKDLERHLLAELRKHQTRYSSRSSKKATGRFPIASGHSWAKYCSYTHPVFAGGHGRDDRRYHRSIKDGMWMSIRRCVPALLSTPPWVNATEELSEEICGKDGDKVLETTQEDISRALGARGKRVAFTDTHRPVRCASLASDLHGRNVEGEVIRAIRQLLESACGAGGGSSSVGVLVAERDCRLFP